VSYETPGRRSSLVVEGQGSREGRERQPKEEGTVIVGQKGSNVRPVKPVHKQGEAAQWKAEAGSMPPQTGVVWRACRAISPGVVVQAGRNVSRGLHRQVGRCRIR